MSTNTWLAMKHYGVDSQPQTYNGTVESCLRKQVQFVAENPLRGRFVFCMAASEEEALKGLIAERKGPIPKAQKEAAEADDMFARIMGNITSAAEEANQQEA